MTVHVKNFYPLFVSSVNSLKAAIGSLWRHRFRVAPGKGQEMAEQFFALRLLIPGRRFAIHKQCCTSAHKSEIFTAEGQFNVASLVQAPQVT